MLHDPEPPAAFLAQLGQELKTREGVDGDLAKIVAEHILTATPANDCLEQALAAIEGLALARATHPKASPNG